MAEAKNKAKTLKGGAELVTLRVDDLVERLREGRLRTAGWPGERRWGFAERADLLRSLFRGYPIGAPVLWRRDAPDSRHPGGERPSAPVPRGEVLWVVDGRERVLTLAEAMARPSSPGGYVPVFDAGAGRFLYVPGPGPDGRAFWGANEVPAYVLLDQGQFAQWLQERRPGPALRLKSLEASKRLREGSLAAYIVETEDADVVQSIVARADPFRGATGPVVRPPADSMLGLDEMAGSLAGLGLPGAAAAAYVGEALDLLDPPADPSQAQGHRKAHYPRYALSPVELSMRKALLFAVQAAGLPHPALAPTPRALAALSSFFYAYPEPSEESRALLRRWLWRAWLREATPRSFAEPFEVHFTTLRTESETVRHMLDLMPSEAPRAPLELSGLDLRSSWARLLCAPLVALGPRDLTTGEPLDVRPLLEAGDRLPLCYLFGPEPPTSARLGSLVLHPPLGPEQLAAALTTKANAAALASHAITPSTLRALTLGNVNAFVAEREAALRAHVESYFGQRAAWGADEVASPGRPSLSR